MHPELYRRAQSVLGQELEPSRVGKILATVVDAWTDLGYDATDVPPFDRSTILALASLVAGVLEAEAALGGGGRDWDERRNRVMLRLVPGGVKG